MFRRVAVCTCLGTNAWRHILLPDIISEWDEHGSLPFCQTLFPLGKLMKLSAMGRGQAKTHRTCKIRAVCVFGGINHKVRSGRDRTAHSLAKALRERGLDLVYGGGKQGQVGHIAETLKSAGRHVLSVIPKSMKEQADKTIGEVILVNTLHERKEVMFRHSDAFIAIPGGLVTLDSLMEVTVGARLSIHKKPIGILNLNGYYDHLIEHFDNAVREGVMKQAHRSVIMSSTDADELLQKLENYVPVRDPGLLALKWEDAGRSQNNSSSHLPISPTLTLTTRYSQDRR